MKYDEMPIRFNTHMVRAILDGEKTSTRRIIEGINKQKNNLLNDIKEIYRLGQTLYVKETWCDRWLPDGYLNGRERYGYKADCVETQYSYGYWGDAEKGKHGIWKPNTFMPKEAARIYLKVTDIDTQRLQDITENQAKSEGVFLSKYYIEENLTPNYIALFKGIWNLMLSNKNYNLYNWEINPWVWAIQFEVVDIKLD